MDEDDAGRSVEVFTCGEDICTCGLQASLTPLRAICELLCAKRKWSRIEQRFDQKEKDKDFRKGSRSVEVFDFGEDIRLLRLTSELVDLRKGYANSFAQSANGVESNTPTKK